MNNLVPQLLQLVHGHIAQSHIYLAIMAAIAGHMGAVRGILKAILKVVPKDLLMAEVDKLAAEAKTEIVADSPAAQIPPAPPAQG